MPEFYAPRPAAQREKFSLQRDQTIGQQDLGDPTLHSLRRWHPKQPHLPSTDDAALQKKPEKFGNVVAAYQLYQKIATIVSSLVIGFLFSKFNLEVVAIVGQLEDSTLE